MNAHNNHFLHMAGQTLGRDLLQGLLQEIRIMPDCWQKLNEAAQTEVIERLESQITHAVGRAVHIIASAERTTLVGKLEQVTNKSKIKAVFVIDPREEGRHELSDTVGKDCLLVIASAGDYLEGMDQVVADPDQNPLDLNGGDGDMSENGAWETDVEAAEAEFTDVPALPGVETFGGHTFGDVCRFVVTRLTQLDAAKLQSRFAISLEQAQRLIIMLLDEGVITIEVEAEDPADNQYKVVAELTDLDINME